MRTFVFASLILAACGGDKAAPDAAVKDVGFNKPVGPNGMTLGVHANDTASPPNDLGPADLTCLNTPSTDVATTVQVTLTTTVTDFQSHNAVPAAMVTAFPDINYQSQFDTETSDQNGNITFTIPPGTKRFGFQMTGTAAMIFPTFLLQQYLDPNMPTQTMAKIQSVSTATAQTLPALIGETRMPGTGVLAGTFFDCQGRPVSNYIATVSSTSGTATPLAGAESFYFSAGVDLPVHHTQQEAASGDGLFMTIQLPATTTAYVQLWGFPTDGATDLELMSELQVPVLADTVITGSFYSIRQ